MIGQTPILPVLDNGISLLKTDEQALSALHSLVVLSAVDWFYRSDDLSRGNDKRMLSAAVDLVSDLLDAFSAPILLTQHRTDSLTEPIRNPADNAVHCK